MFTWQFGVKVSPEVKCYAPYSWVLTQQFKWSWFRLDQTKGAWVMIIWRLTLTIHSQGRGQRLWPIFIASSYVICMVLVSSQSTQWFLSNGHLKTWPWIFNFKVTHSQWQWPWPIFIVHGPIIHLVSGFQQSERQFQIYGYLNIWPCIQFKVKVKAEVKGHAIYLCTLAQRFMWSWFWLNLTEGPRVTAIKIFDLAIFGLRSWSRSLLLHVELSTRNNMVLFGINWTKGYCVMPLYSVYIKKLGSRSRSYWNN